MGVKVEDPPRHSRDRRLLLRHVAGLSVFPLSRFFRRTEFAGVEDAELLLAIFLHPEHQRNCVRGP